MKYKVGAYVIPKGTKTITQVTEIEKFEDVTIVYTEAGSYSHSQIEAVEKVFDRQLTKDLRSWLKKILAD